MTETSYHFVHFPHAGVEQAMKMWQGKKNSHFCSCPPLFQFAPPTYWGHMPFLALPVKVMHAVSLWPNIGVYETLRQISYHGLYGSTSCCISHGPSQWKRAIFDPPQLGDPWTDFHETWNIQLLPGHDPACKILGAYVDVGGLGK